MASSAQAAPARRPVSKNFVDFLRAELAPHPGIYFTLVRVIVSVVITFLIAATFRMPYAAIMLYSVFTIDRSSRRAAILRATESVVAVTIGTAAAFLGVVLFIQLPLLSFAWYALELFAAAFLIRTTRLLGPAMNMGMAIYTVHNVWESPYPAPLHIEQTLWVWLTLCLGFVVSVAVELAFVREDPLQQIRIELTRRLRALSSLFSAMASHSEITAAASETVLSYAYTGTSSIRQRVLSIRNTEGALHPELLALNTATALLARLIDVSANINPSVAPSNDDAARLQALATELGWIRGMLEGNNSIQPSQYQPSTAPSGRMPFLPELERTTALIPAAFYSSEQQDAVVAQLFDPLEHVKVFVPDAFTNRGYLLFAMKTMFAALLCYIMYSALDWPGISTAVVTCLVTALNTVGATKQKQLLRLSGATFGGLLALGSIVFLLPEIDSITGVTILITAVSAFSGWFALASQRLSYFGLQTALAFYLALIQDYSSTAHLAPARDRALGVLLGVSIMWLVFDNLWPTSAAEHMRTGLARNFRWLAEIVTALDQPDRVAAIRAIRGLRDRIQTGFATVHGHADSVLFEFGSANRARDLALRDSILRAQAALRTLFVVELAICQYRTQVVPGKRPPEIRETICLFDEAFSSKLVKIADAVQRLEPPPAEPSLTILLQQFDERIDNWIGGLGDEWIKTRALGIRALTRQAAEITDALAENCTWC